jgi:DNA primase
MDDTAKYLIRADIVADGVVERTDVVGAVFGQTEGLLGEELDIRGLQESSKLGRIDVDVESEGGQSFGRLTIGSDLDRTQTAILAAALETIDRVGPCRAHVEVTAIEDARAAKRRAVVERAKELLSTSFSDTLDSEDIVAEVRESTTVEDVVEYEGLPAGPRVAEGDAVILVEGRADVVRLLEYGIKNALAVGGTNVPDAVADVCEDRTATAFLDGDRGGELILRELAQVAAVDFVARAPEGESVEDLPRQAVMRALREKRPLRRVLADLDGGEGATPVRGDGEGGVTSAGAADSSPPDPAESPSPNPESHSDDRGDSAGSDDAGVGTDADDTDPGAADQRGGAAGEGGLESTDGESRQATGEGGTGTADGTDTARADPGPETLAAHAEAVVAAGTGTARLLDRDCAVLAECGADAAFETLSATDEPPYAVVLDGTVTQRLLDLAAQRGVPRVVGAERGEFTKQPAAVRVHTAAEV